MFKYSIIVPVYNVEKYLKKCLDSICSQIFTDFEIIVVDDGSTDSSGEIADSYQNLYSFIKVIHQNNMGLGGARNTGIVHASGEYIWCIDSDDYITSDALKTIDNAVTSGNYDCAVFNLEYVDEDGNVLKEQKGVSAQIKNFSLRDYSAMLCEPVAAWNKVVRKSVISASGVVYPDHRYYEDLSTIGKYYPAVKEFVYIDKVLYCYVQRQGSIMHSNKTQKMKDDIISAVEQLLDYYKDKNIFNSFEDELSFVCAYHVLFLQSVRLIKAGGSDELLGELYKFTKSQFPHFLFNKYLKHYLSFKDFITLFLITTKQYRLLRYIFR